MRGAILLKSPLRYYTQRMTLNLDYIFSSTVSVLIHGAVGFGLYGSMLSGPHINFQSGNNGIGVSIISPSELRSGSAVSGGIVAAQPAVAQPQAPQQNAEIQLKPVTARVTSQRQAKLVPVKQVEKPAAAQAVPSEQANAAQDRGCSGAVDCGMRSSLGRTGDHGVSNLGLLRAPKPPYPWAARRAGFEGRVIVAVEVAKDGSVRTAELAKSSGREDCDQSAVETIRDRWYFEPARINGQPIDWRENIVVVYDLKK